VKKTNLSYSVFPLRFYTTVKLGLHVNLVTRGNEAAAAGIPFARLPCTQDNRVTHEWRLLVHGQCHPAGIQLLELLQGFSKARQWLWAVLLT